MALCIRDMAKAAGAYTKFENPDHFPAVNTENGTRPDLLFVGIQEQRILGDVLITEPCSKTLTRHQANTQGWAAKRGEVSKVSKYGGPASQGGQIFLPFVFETYGLWGKDFQDFFAATMRQAEEFRGIPKASSSTQSELRALQSVVVDIIFIVELCKELGREIKLPAIVFEDNEAVIALSREMTSRAKRCKHFLMIVNWIREHVEAGLIELRQIPDEANVADVLTKIITGKSFKTKAGRLLGSELILDPSG